LWRLPVLLGSVLLVGAGSLGNGPLEITSETLSVVPGSRTALAKGNVVARSATFEAQADEGEATYSAAEPGKRRSIERLTMRGRFQLKRFKDGLTATSAQAIYTEENDTVSLTGDPVVTRGSDVLRGDKIDVGTLDDRVLVQSPKVDLARRRRSDAVHVRGEQLTVLDGGAKLRFERNVHVKEGSFTSRSDRMDAYMDTSGGGSQLSKLVFLGHVEAKRGNETATAGRATYEASTGNLVMEDNPLLIQNGNELRGDRITINSATGRATVEKVDITIRGGRNE
jgi:lipopolysaccharide transport protein LptA